MCLTAAHYNQDATEFMHVSEIIIIIIVIIKVRRALRVCIIMELLSPSQHDAGFSLCSHW